MKFEEGDEVILKDYDINAPPGTVRDLSNFGENFVFTVVGYKNDSLLVLEEYEDGAFPERFILARPYLQKLEAKKLLGLK